MQSWGCNTTAYALASVYNYDMLILKADGKHSAIYSHGDAPRGVIVLAHLRENHYLYATPCGMYIVLC